MREILHRGKVELSNDKLDELQIPHDDGWVYGNVVIDGHIAFIISGIAEWDEEYFAPKWWVRVDKDTIGQFTGLHDKNGKRIFEGDIVKCGTNKAGAVEYDPYETLYHVGNDPLQYYVYGSAEPETMRVEIEIIGNIHDKEASP